MIYKSNNCQYIPQKSAIWRTREVAPSHFETARSAILASVLRVCGELRGVPLRAIRVVRGVSALAGARRAAPPRHAAPARHARATRAEVPTDVRYCYNCSCYVLCIVSMHRAWRACE